MVGNPKVDTRLISGWTPVKKAALNAVDEVND